MSRPAPTEKILLSGAAGHIDTLLDLPAEVRGIALVCHPHPLYGGANTNKVVHTLARTLRDLGYAALRPNFRGVGESDGTHDEGRGEVQDMLRVLAWAQSRWQPGLPIALAGFSFGGFIQTRVAHHLADAGSPAQRLALVGLACGNAADGSRDYPTPPLPAGGHALVIHGEEDDTVPLANVLDWARPQALPVTVIPGTGHFFHARLTVLRDLLLATWTPL